MLGAKYADVGCKVYRFCSLADGAPCGRWVAIPAFWPKAAPLCTPHLPHSVSLPELRHCAPEPLVHVLHSQSAARSEPAALRPLPLPPLGLGLPPPVPEICSGGSCPHTMHISLPMGTMYSQGWPLESFPWHCQCVLLRLGAMDAEPWCLSRRRLALARVTRALSDCLWRCRRLAFEVVVAAHSTTVSVVGPNDSRRDAAQLLPCKGAVTTGGYQRSEPKQLFCFS